MSRKDLIAVIEDQLASTPTTALAHLVALVVKDVFEGRVDDGTVARRLNRMFILLDETEDQLSRVLEDLWDLGIDRDYLGQRIEMRDQLIKERDLFIEELRPDADTGRRVRQGARRGGKQGGRGRSDDGKDRPQPDDIRRAVGKVHSRYPKWSFRKACQHVAEAAASPIHPRTVERHAQAVKWPKQ